MTKLSLEEVRTALELYVALRRAGLEQSAIDEFINNDEYAECLVAALDPAPVTRAGFPFVDQPIDKLGFAPQLQIKLEREGVGSIGVLALCTQQELRRMRNIATASIDAIKLRLKAGNLQLRRDDEDVLVKAAQLYPDIAEMPVYVMFRNIGIEEDAARKLCVAYANYTLDEVIQQGDDGLRNQLTIASPHQPAATAWQMSVIEQFLAKLNLSFSP